MTNKYQTINYYKKQRLLFKMKNLSGKTLIFYTFQTASKSAQYNVTTFKKSSPQQPKIRDVLYELPLDYASYSYHFRFKSQFFQNDEKIIGWIDISNLLAKVPVVNNNIFVKILQLPSDQNNKLFNKEKLTAIGLLDPKGENHSNGQYKPPQIPTVNNNTPTTPTTRPLTKPPTNAVPSTPKKNQQNPTNPPIKKSTSDILDLESPIINNQSPKNPKRVTSQSPKKVFVPGGQTPQQMLKSFQETCKRQEQQRNLQRQAIAFHQKKLTEWGYSGHKTINNLTTLLATLHDIWPQWQQVSLSDMLRPEDVTALYKKAVVKLHPDKNVDKDYQTKYLSKRIFQLLNEAKKAQRTQQS